MLPLTKVKRVFGGNGGNIARGMALLGSKPLLISDLGNDGADYLQRISSAGLRTDAITIHPNIPSTTVYFLIDRCRREIALFISEASRNAQFNPKLLDEDTEIIHVAGHAKLSRDVLQFSKTNDIKSVFDPGQDIHKYSPQDLQYCLERATFTMLNEQENIFVIENGMQETLSKTFQILTKGSKGVTLKQPGMNAESIPPCPTAKPIFQTVGAGDAFRSGFLHAISKGQDPKNAAMLGCSVATLSLESGQSQLPSLDHTELQKRLVEAYGVNAPKVDFPMLH